MQTAHPTMEVSAEASTSSRFRVPAVTTFFSRRWWWTTLLVLVGIAVLVRLGFWQLDRLEQRRAHNAGVRAQLAQSPLAVNGDALPAALEELKNRRAVAQGEYDLSRQVALTHQNWVSTPGFRLITPLVLADGARSGDLRSTSDDARLLAGRPLAVLVDRGWLPAAQLEQENWSQYDITGPVAVSGYIKLSQTAPNPKNSLNTEGLDEAATELQPEWYRVDIPAIEAQMPYELLPVYLQQAPSPKGNSELPFRSELDADLSEGNHLSYAIQWFIFAAILAVGYVYFVGRKTGERADSRL